MTHPHCKDDPSLKDDQLLLRQILKFFIDNGRITASAFAPHRTDPKNLHCSVDIESKRPPEDLLGSLYSEEINYDKRGSNAAKRLRQGHKVAAVKVGTVRKYSQKVFPDSCYEEYKDGPQLNQAHATICGEKGDELLQELAEEANENIILC